MSDYQTRLSSFETTKHSLGYSGRREKSRAEQSAEMFLSSHSSSNFLTRYSSRIFNVSHVFTGLLFGLFIVVLLITIVIGTNVYRALYESSQTVADDRSATSLLYNVVRTIDSSNSLLVTHGPEGPALVLKEYVVSGTYETRLYLYDGNLVEEYAHEGTPFNPLNAVTLVGTDTFDFHYRDGLLTIITDHGQIDVALRCEIGGE